MLKINYFCDNLLHNSITLSKKVSFSILRSVLSIPLFVVWFGTAVLSLHISTGPTNTTNNHLMKIRNKIFSTSVRIKLSKSAVVKDRKQDPLPI